jgi:secondary thiamine-phosphate synthase enzyme
MESCRPAAFQKKRKRPLTGRLGTLLGIKILMIKEFSVSSEKRYQLIDISDEVEKTVEESGIEDGFILVFTPHSTAAVLLTENEEGLKQDWLDFLKKSVVGFDFQHNKIDNNADSHILSGLIGQGKTLPLEKGRIIRGTWQQIFLVELDGPRNRKIIVKINK